MLISKEVIVEVGRNLSYYENLGYKIPKYINVKKLPTVKKGTKIEVNVSDLKKDSICRVNVECDYCKKIFNSTYKNYNISKENSIIQKDCCKECCKYKREESNLIKYGQTSHMKIDKYKKMFSKDYDEVKKSFLNKNYKLISTEYKYSSDPLEFVCEKHINKGIQRISWTQLNRGFGCKYCSYELKGSKMCGENHPNWKGGISSLTKYIRDYLKDWKFNSLKINNFKCSLTGIDDGTLVVHHLYSFKLILEESLNNLKFSIKKNINDYTEDELKLIKQECIKLHYDKGLGVPVVERLHKIFHSIYGNLIIDNGEFFEFDYRYKNFEFNDLLEEKYKYKKI